MLRNCAILLLWANSALAVPQASQQAELQRLVRLPRIEFAQPLAFDRIAGFLVFPDASTATLEAAKDLAEVKAVPPEAPKFLETARFLRAHRELGAAIRAYGRAADLFRIRVEAQEDAVNLAGLAESLTAIGRRAEGLAHLQKALALAAKESGILAAALRVYRDGIWQLFAGDRRFFATEPFLESLVGAVKEPPDAGKIEEAQRLLGLASLVYDRLSADTEEAIRERAIFLSFRGAIAEAIAQAKNGEIQLGELSKRLFSPDALLELNRVADHSDDPALLAAVAFAKARAESRLQPVDRSWTHLGQAARGRVLELAGRLDTIADAGHEDSAEAAEYLGCIQLAILRDIEGAERSFRAALRRDPNRHRSWDLLILAAAESDDPSNLLRAAEERFEALPTSRSSVFLAKGYDRVGDETRAELICLASLAVHPKDFLLNLTLAAIILQRENVRENLWRVRDLIGKAEKQIIGSATSQNALDLALTKSIFLALSDKPNEARAALNAFASGASAPPEVQEVLRVLERGSSD